MQNNIHRSLTYLTKITINKIPNRTMFKLARQSSINIKLIRSTTHNQVTYREMTVIKAYKFKKSAVKDLANDETGKHPHICKESCVQSDCQTKKCTTLCDKFQDFSIKGHSTHGPVPGKFSKFISEVDSSGNKKTQYFIRSPKKRIIDATTKQQYNQNGEVKEDIKQTSYIHANQDIHDKLDQE